ncbi:hypothetical protein C6A37_03650 [Desulfobacteraceae bacterium SEEP-SAG9]|nr:hypothetical protein C6A37_03650 [Desulfobacteraceae bacterium SEEP-SAG9]
MGNEKMKGVFQKKGYWYARIDGQEKYCGKGDKGHDLAVAAKAKEIAKAYENREINTGLKVRRTTLKTVQDVANWYMTLPNVQAKKSFDRYAISAGHLLRYFGKRPANMVEADEQERYGELRRAQGAADATINFDIRVLSAMYHLASRRKLIPLEYLPGEFITRGGSAPRRIVTDDEYQGILEQSDSEDFKDLVTAAYESAMRSREVTNLTPSQVKLDVQHISGQVLDYIDLGIFDTKTASRRTVPVSPELKAILEKRMRGLEPDDRIFTINGGKWYSQTIGEKLRAACKKAEIPYGDKNFDKKGNRVGVVFHCFRNTRTTKWVEAGFSDEIIRRATGHRSLSAYQQYVKLGPSAVMRLVDTSESLATKPRQNRREAL